MYHLTSPPPVIPGTDAVFQEIDAISKEVNGEYVQLFPLKRPTVLFPKPLYGWHQYSRIRNAQYQVDVHHIFYATLYAFPILNTFKSPLVYSVVAGLPPGPRPSLPVSLHTIVISNERDRKQLDDWGITNYRVIRPGVDLGRFTYAPPAAGRKFVLLVGSAPWTRAQFRQKGIDALLDLAADEQDLELVFLWRGLLSRELRRRIARRSLGNRTRIINEPANVNEVLAQVHATVVLADSAKLIKAYPHSLMESLAAGKPVLISDCIPMADHVRKFECGQVVSGTDLDSLRTAVGQLRARYDSAQRATTSAREAFDLQRMLAEYRDLYVTI